MKKIYISLLIILFFNILYAQDEINVLFLGNSYTNVNNLPEMTSELLNNTNKKLNYMSFTPGAYTLLQHVNNDNTLSLIRQGGWDFVVLQEQSQLPTIDYYRYSMMNPAYQALYDSVKLYNPGAMLVGYMTWGRRYGGQQCEDYGYGLYCSADFVDFNHMQDSLCSAYCENAFATDTYVAPVGMAWKKILEETDIVLHSADDSHPTYEGSYLAACVLHAVFWKESPIGVYHDPRIGDKNAALLQKAADETVFTNPEQWNIGTDAVRELIQKHFKVISNPFDNLIKIENEEDIEATIKIFNLNGILVKGENFTSNTIIEVPPCSGIYIVQIIGKDGLSQIEKIIKF